MDMHEIARGYGVEIKDCEGDIGTNAMPADKAKRLAAELSAAGFPAITERGPLPLMAYVTLVTQG